MFDKHVAAPREGLISSFSVVIPNYNYGRFLSEAIESVLVQPVDVTLLVVDNASTDDSVAVARSFAERDPRVSVVEREKNLGLIASLNEGVAWATGTYFVNLSSDDVLTPGALARAGAMLDAHPTVGFVYGRPVHFARSDDKPALREGPPQWSVRPGKEWLGRRCREGHSVLSQPEATARTELVQAMGGYDERLPHTSDVEYFLRLSARADVGYLRGADQVYYRVHGANMSLGYMENYLPDLKARWDAFSSLLEKDSDRLSAPDVLRGQVGEALAREALWRVCRAIDQGRTSDLPVAELEAFAYTVFPGAADLPEHRLLERRQRHPWYAALARHVPVGAARRRAELELWRRRWLARGE